MEVATIGRERPRVRSVGIGQPEVLIPAPVAHEEDACPVRREDRLQVERHPARDACRVTARPRDRIEVAEQIEDDRLTIG